MDPKELARQQSFKDFQGVLKIARSDSRLARKKDLRNLKEKELNSFTPLGSNEDFKKLKEKEMKQENENYMNELIINQTLVEDIGMIGGMINSGYMDYQNQREITDREDAYARMQLGIDIGTIAVGAGIEAVTAGIGLPVIAGAVGSSVVGATAQTTLDYNKSYGEMTGGEIAKSFAINVVADLALEGFGHIAKKVLIGNRFKKAIPHIESNLEDPISSSISKEAFITRNVSGEAMQTVLNKGELDGTSNFGTLYEKIDGIGQYTNPGTRPEFEPNQVPRKTLRAEDTYMTKGDIRGTKKQVNFIGVKTEAERQIDSSYTKYITEQTNLGKLDTIYSRNQYNDIYKNKMEAKAIKDNIFTYGAMVKVSRERNYKWSSKSPQVLDMGHVINEMVDKAKVKELNEINANIVNLSESRHGNLYDFLKKMDEEDINITHVMSDPDYFKGHEDYNTMKYISGYQYSTIGSKYKLVRTTNENNIKGSERMFDVLNKTGFTEKFMNVVDSLESHKTEYELDLSSLEGKDISKEMNDLINKSIRNEKLNVDDFKSTKDTMMKIVYDAENFRNRGIEREFLFANKEEVLKNLREPIGKYLSNSTHVLNDIKNIDIEKLEPIRQLLKKEHSGYRMIDIGRQKYNSVKIEGNYVDIEKSTLEDLMKSYEVNEVEALQIAKDSVKTKLGESIRREVGSKNPQRVFDYLCNKFGLSQDYTLSLKSNRLLKKEQAFGLFDTGNKTIHIKNDMDDMHILSTIRHELEHARDISTGKESEFYNSELFNPSPKVSKVDKSKTIKEALDITHNSHFAEEKLKSEMLESSLTRSMNIKKGFIHKIGSGMEGNPRKWDFDNDEDLVNSIWEMSEFFNLSTTGSGKKVNLTDIVKTGFKDVDSFRRFSHELGGGTKIGQELLIKNTKDNAYKRSFGLSKSEYFNALTLDKHRKHYRKNGFEYDESGTEIHKNNALWEIPRLIKKSIEPNNINKKLELNIFEKGAKATVTAMRAKVLIGGGNLESLTAPITNSMNDVRLGNMTKGKFIKEFVSIIPKSLIDSGRITGSGIINILDATSKATTGKRITNIKAIKAIEKILDISKGSIEEERAMVAMLKDIGDLGYNNSNGFATKRINNFADIGVKSQAQGDYILTSYGESVAEKTMKNLPSKFEDLKNLDKIFVTSAGVYDQKGLDTIRKKISEGLTDGAENSEIERGFNSVVSEYDQVKRGRSMINNDIAKWMEYKSTTMAIVSKYFSDISTTRIDGIKISAEPMEITSNILKTLGTILLSGAGTSVIYPFIKNMGKPKELSKDYENIKESLEDEKLVGKLIMDNYVSYISEATLSSVYFGKSGTVYGSAKRSGTNIIEGTMEKDYDKVIKELVPSKVKSFMGIFYLKKRKTKSHMETISYLESNDFKDVLEAHIPILIDNMRLDNEMFGDELKSGIYDA